MSFSSAISSALAGLSTNTRRADIVASNVAQASDPGYARRELDVGGIKRILDPVLLADRRLSDAETANAAIRARDAARIEQAFGNVDQGDTLAQKVVAFDTALISATGDPSSALRLDAVARAAKDIVTGFHGAQSDLQALRQDADAEIGQMVDRLNELLASVASLNTRISVAKHGDAQTATLQDLRQKSIDEIASMVELRVVHRERGEVTLYTSRGGVLVSDSASTVDFTRTGVIAPHMSQDNGLLSGLRLNGRAISTGPSGPLDGGSLAALFATRDVTSVAAQRTLDGIALDLVERFGAGGPDPSIPTAGTGLFTDEGAVPGAPPASGLAGRLALDGRIFPGSVENWRLRDGISASAPGRVGDTTLLNGLRNALAARAVPTDAALDGRAASLEDHLAELGARSSTLRVNEGRAAAEQSARNSALKEIEYANGVDSDVELQNLLEIEQSYNANAQVLSVIDQMMKRLLNL